MLGLIDPSEPCVVIAALLALVGLFVGAIGGSTLFSVVCGVTLVVLGISLWRIRILGTTATLAHSAQELREQNEVLSQSVEDLEQQNRDLEFQVGRMSGLLGIMEEQGKTAEEVQRDMLETLGKLETENKRYERLNRGHAFMVADHDHDGILTTKEQETLRILLPPIQEENEVCQVVDRDGDGVVSRGEYLTFQ